MIPKISMILVSIVVIFVVGSAVANLCPGHRIRCRNDQTCCSDKKGSYGCCPYTNATCWSDGAHCCPHNTVCDTIHSRCRMQSEDSELTLLVPANEIDSESESNELTNDITDFLTLISKKQCPDGKRTCPDSYTCCEEYSGGFGCCPHKNAVCCKDKIHCTTEGGSC